LKKLNGKVVADLSETTLANDIVQKNLNESQAAEIQKKAADPGTGYRDTTLMPNMVKNIIDNGTPGAKRYTQRQISSGTVSGFTYEYEKELRTQMKEYDKAKTTGDQVGMAKAEGEMRSIVGRVDAKDIADLKEDIHQHEGVAATYKRAHISALQNRQKEKGDLSEDFVEKFHNNINTNNGDKGIRKSLDEAVKNKKSSFFNEKIIQRRLEDIKKPGGLRERTEDRATDPGASPEDQAAAAAELQKLDKEAQKLEKTLNEP
jgi:hypothetical protein